MDRWYSVKVLFESIHTGQSNTSLHEESNEKWFEESVVVVRAGSAEDAERRALRHAEQSEHAYRNGHGETVKWRFVRVIRVFELNDDVITDGTEVYSNFVVARKSDSVEDVINRYYTDELDK